jgi:hypothetical protein
MAERAGFEPALGYYPKHAFQACDLNHSSTSPVGSAPLYSGMHGSSSRDGVLVGLSVKYTVKLPAAPGRYVSTWNAAPLLRNGEEIGLEDAHQMGRRGQLYRRNRERSRRGDGWTTGHGGAQHRTTPDGNAAPRHRWLHLHRRSTYSQERSSQG